MIQRVLRILSIKDPRPTISRTRPSLLVLTGPTNSGKTRTLRRWLCEWEQEGLRLGGIVSDAVWNFTTKIGYDLVDVSNGTLFPVIRNTPFPRDLPLGKYHLDLAGLEEVTRVAAGAPCCDILVIDEIGPLELEHNGGFINTFSSCLTERNCSLCVIVRDSLLDAFLERYQHMLKQGRQLL